MLFRLQLKNLSVMLRENVFGHVEMDDYIMWYESQKELNMFYQKLYFQIPKQNNMKEKL